MRKVIATSDAPTAVGPYSQAIRIGNGLIYVSGQIPLDPDPVAGKTIAGGIEEQTVRVLENLKAILEAGESSLQNVVKTTVYLTDLNDFAAVNTIYAKYFPVDPPARVCVQVAALPLGAKIEIDAVATEEREYSY